MSSRCPRSKSRHLLLATRLGRTWRYELEPVEGGTRIRETWDVSTEALPTRFLLKPLLAEHTRESMERTLARIEELLRD